MLRRRPRLRSRPPGERGGGIPLDRRGRARVAFEGIGPRRRPGRAPVFRSVHNTGSVGRRGRAHGGAGGPPDAIPDALYYKSRTAPLCGAEPVGLTGCCDVGRGESLVHRRGRCASAPRSGARALRSLGPGHPRPPRHPAHVLQTAAAPLAACLTRRSCPTRGVYHIPTVAPLRRRPATAGILPDRPLRTGGRRSWPGPGRPPLPRPDPPGHNGGMSGFARCGARPVGETPLRPETAAR